MTATSVRATTETAEIVEAKTKHGKVNYYAKPSHAAKQASRDLAAYLATGEARTNGAGPVGAIPVAAIGAAAAAAQTAIAAGQLGTMIASTVSSGSNGTGSVEVTITNYSSTMVVPFDYSTTKCDMSNFPNPLIAGETDVFLLTNSGSFPSDVATRLDFLVGTGKTAIQVQLFLSRSSDVWRVGVAVDEHTKHTFAEARQMFGFTFIADKPANTPSFSVYITPVETANGMMSIMVCSKGASESE